MLLTPEEIQQQTAEIWQTAFPTLSAAQRELFFTEYYRPEGAVTVREEGNVVAAAQVLPYRFNFGGKPLSAALLTGCCCLPDKKREQQRMEQLLAAAHRKMYQEGRLLSFYIPSSAAEQHRFEQEGFGAYWTASHRITVPLNAETAAPLPKHVTLQPEYEWGKEFWTFYNTFGGRHDYELRLNEEGFFAAIVQHDLNDGEVIVARRKHKIIGLCLAKHEGKLLKSGKRSTKNKLAHISYMLTTDSALVYQFAAYLQKLWGVTEVEMTGGCPMRGFQGSRSYAMARVLNVEAFLQHVGRVHPSLQFAIGVEHDFHLPENNGNYDLFEGRLTLLPQAPDNVVTPGGLAALFLGSQPVQLPLLFGE